MSNCLGTNVNFPTFSMEVLRNQRDRVKEVGKWERGRVKVEMRRYALDGFLESEISLTEIALISG